MQELPVYFGDLIQVITAYIENRANHFTLQTYGGDYIDGPYVQALQEQDNILLIEAVSNEFLNPPHEKPGQETMLFMGWRFFPEHYLPNYAQFIDQSKISPMEIAILMVRALHFGYGVDDTYTFEIAPQLDAVVPLIERMGLVNG